MAHWVLARSKLNFDKIKSVKITRPILGQWQMTIKYHGTPITPKAVLQQLAGKHFCVSFADPRNLKDAHRIGQSVMHDNGAYSIWKQNKKSLADWTPYYKWVEPNIINAVHWAVIPDDIEGSSEVQDQLLLQWPFKYRGAPVWHMHEPIKRLLHLSDNWPRVCIGSSAQFKQVGSYDWRLRMGNAFNELTKRHKYLPWIHMLRGINTLKFDYPFSPVDSTDIARNHHTKLHNNPAKQMAERWDAMNCPEEWITKNYLLPFREN